MWNLETEYAHAHEVRQTDCSAIGAGCFIKKLHKCILYIYIYIYYNLLFTK